MPRQTRPPHRLAAVRRHPDRALSSPVNDVTESSSDDSAERRNFIEAVVEQDLAAGLNEGRVHTRFPPEPNGYLHIGHAKAIFVNYNLPEKYGGKFNLRFDDTNPSKEETEYVDSIMEDMRWLGADWEDRLFFTSDYFEQLYGFAVQIIERGDAYVCDLSLEEVREYRGTGAGPGRNSPWRDRSVEENLDLFRRMRAGEFADGAKTLRAKIDMAATNMNLRDPVMYRIMRHRHHRTGDAWCIYPMYDWAHGQSDAIEAITHSCCSLEFRNHRPLYDWFLDHFDAPHRPKQLEFSRLNVAYTVMSKRKLVQLVQDGHVSGWDDPRMPTVRGLRRRGYTPEAIRAFCDTVGVTKVDSVIDMVVLENHLREDLNRRAERRMAVLNPLKLVIENWPEGKVEQIEAVNNPEDENAGTRMLPFGRELWIDAADFLEDAPKKYFRLAPGREVRLRYAWCVTCTDVVKNDAGEVVEVRCTYDPETSHGRTPDGRKVKGIIHWVSAEHAIEAPVRLYDHLFSNPAPDDVPEGGDFTDNLNPESLVELAGCRLEPSLAGAAPGESFQFERVGYFCADLVDSRPGAPVFNRSVSLRDTWAKIANKAGGG